MIQNFWYFCTPLVPLFWDLRILYLFYKYAKIWYFETFSVHKKGYKGVQKVPSIFSITIGPNDHFCALGMFQNDFTKKTPKVFRHTGRNQHFRGIFTTLGFWKGVQRSFLAPIFFSKYFYV